jgi:hypothetical protein
MKRRRGLKLVGIASAAAAALVLVVGPAAFANSGSHNYSAPNCTQTTITGHNTWSGSTFSGYTTRTQDICPPGTSNTTSVYVYNTGGVYTFKTTTGLTTPTAVLNLGCCTGADHSSHAYAGFGFLVHA